MRGPTHIMTLNDTNSIPLPAMADLINRHGTLAVGFAYLRAALARRHHPPDLRAHLLSDHLRRDLGLPPLGDGPMRRGAEF